MNRTLTKPTAGGCAGCGAELPPVLRGRPRKWCSERCRKGSYGDPCIDCGARTAYGAETARVPEPRCSACAPIHYSHWTCERIVEAIREWAVEHGEPPAAPDWMPIKARQLHDTEREQRARDGIAAHIHPDARWVFKRFGSWNAAIEAAGFAARAAHGGCGNGRRKRSVRARVHPLGQEQP